jgi:hypothetical protein
MGKMKSISVPNNIKSNYVSVNCEENEFVEWIYQFKDGETRIIGYDIKTSSLENNINEFLN